MMIFKHNHKLYKDENHWAGEALENKKEQLPEPAAPDLCHGGGEPGTDDLLSSRGNKTT